MEIPYFLVLEATLTSNGTGTVSYSVPGNEKLELRELVFVSTGAFNVTGLRDSSGRNFTNASAAVEIPSTVLASGANGYNALKAFPVPVEITGGVTFYADLEDSSGSSNTVTLVFTGIRKT